MTLPAGIPYTLNNGESQTEHAGQADRGLFRLRFNTGDSPDDLEYKHMMFEDRNLAPYSGDQPYVFLSYSHRNAEAAAEVIRQMKQDGFRIWYDEGIIPGTEWDETIAQSIANCSFFVALMSEDYLNSTNCRDELNYARDKNKPRLLVYLEEVQLPAGMEMRMGRNLAIHQYRYEDTAAFYEKLYDAEGIAICLDTPQPAAADTGPRTDETAGVRPVTAGTSEPAVPTGESVQPALPDAENVSAGKDSSRPEPRRIRNPAFLGGAVLLLLVLAAVFFAGKKSSSSDVTGEIGITAASPEVSEAVTEPGPEASAAPASEIPESETAAPDQTEEENLFFTGLLEESRIQNSIRTALQSADPAFQNGIQIASEEDFLAHATGERAMILTGEVVLGENTSGKVVSAPLLIPYGSTLNLSGAEDVLIRDLFVNDGTLVLENASLTLSGETFTVNTGSILVRVDGVLRNYGYLDNLDKVTLERGASMENVILQNDGMFQCDPKAALEARGSIVFGSGSFSLEGFGQTIYEIHTFRDSGVPIGFREVNTEEAFEEALNDSSVSGIRVTARLEIAGGLNLGKPVSIAEGGGLNMADGTRLTVGQTELRMEPGSTLDAMELHVVNGGILINDSEGGLRIRSGDFQVFNSLYLGTDVPVLENSSFGTTGGAIAISSVSSELTPVNFGASGSGVFATAGPDANLTVSNAHYFSENSGFFRVGGTEASFTDVEFAVDLDSAVHFASPLVTVTDSYVNIGGNGALRARNVSLRLSGSTVLENYGTMEVSSRYGDRFVIGPTATLKNHGTLIMDLTTDLLPDSSRIENTGDIREP